MEEAFESEAQVESSKTRYFAVTVNGEEKAIPQGLMISGLLEFLAINPGRVAIELNRAIVRKQDWSATPIEDGARVEIVWFVGGGIS